MLAAALAACSNDEPAEPTLPPFDDTRSAADSTAADGGITISADTAWADTLRFGYDANGNVWPLDDAADTLNIDANNPAGTGNAADAASRRQR